MCVSGEEERKEMYFMDLAYIIVETGKSKICRIGLQAGDPGDKLKLPLESEGHVEVGFPPWRASGCS